MNLSDLKENTSASHYCVIIEIYILDSNLVV